MSRSGLRCAALAALLLAGGAQASVRFEADANRIVVRGQAVTLSSLKAAHPGLPLQRVDRAKQVWLLGASILLADGARLTLNGSKAGGDVDELRLKSDNQPAPGNVVSITADYGSIDIRSTRVIGWDTVAGAPDAEYGQYGRAFLRARSRLATDRVRRLESRMDVIDSEIAYLGSSASEAYGLVWKVSATDNYIFGLVRVRGNLIDSRLHHNFYGAYSFGAHRSTWRNNEVHHNVVYGLAPHNHSNGMTIENNRIHHNGSHGVMLYNQCDHAVLRGNRIWSNAKNGIALRRSSNHALIEDNHVFENGDAGIALLSSAGSRVRHNVLLRNGRSGVQLSAGTSGTSVEGNQLGYNGGGAVQVNRSSEKPEFGDPRPHGNTVADNTIYASPAAVRVADGDRNRFVRNRFHANGAGVQFGAIKTTDVVTDNEFRFAGDAPGPVLTAGAATGMGFFGLRAARQRPTRYCGGRMVAYEPGRGLRLRLDPCGGGNEPRPPERYREAALPPPAPVKAQRERVLVGHADPLELRP